MNYYIGQFRIGQEQAVEHAIRTKHPQLDVFNPRFRRPYAWSNRPAGHEQFAYFFPRYLFVSAALPWQEISKVPGLTLVLNNSEPVEVPLQFIEEMRRQEVQGGVVLSGHYGLLAKLDNSERAKVLIWTFDKDWKDYASWGEIMVAQGMFEPNTKLRRPA